MEAKDYLKYYIGQEAMYGGYGDPERIVKIIGVSLKDGVQFQPESGEADVDPAYEWFKLILRPLSSMTEEEVKEVYAIKRQYPGKTKNSEFEYSSANPIIFHYLLSRGFDLFSLIPSGAAVEKVNEKV